MNLINSVRDKDNLKLGFNFCEGQSISGKGMTFRVLTQSLEGDVTRAHSLLDLELQLLSSRSSNL